MSAPDKQLDSLDEWLARQPLAVSADFTQKTLTRIRRDRELANLSADDCLDALFKQVDCVPADDFAGDALRRVRPHPKRIAGVPAWVATLAGMAASLLLGILAFAFLFHQARNVESVATMAREPLPASAVLVAPTERSTPSTEEPSVLAMEDLFIMDMALQEEFSRISIEERALLHNYWNSLPEDTAREQRREYYALPQAQRADRRRELLDIARAFGLDRAPVPPDIIVPPPPTGMPPPLNLDAPHPSLGKGDPERAPTSTWRN